MDKLSLYPVEGTECFFQCNPGYLPIGRHVCQWHDNDWLKNNTNHTDPEHNSRGWLAGPVHKRKFHGGRCQKLCGELADQTCPSSQSTRRYPSHMMTSNITDEIPAKWAEAHDYDEHVSNCMETECFPTGKDNLWNVAKGVYDVMQIARDKNSGVYYNEVNLDWFVRYMQRTHEADYTVGTGSPVDSCKGNDWFHEALGVYQIKMAAGGEGLNRGGGGKNYSMDATAMGIMTEVVGSALGFQSPTVAMAKVVATIGNLTHGSADEVLHYPNHTFKSRGPYSFDRDSRGYFKHFYGHRTLDATNPMVTALLVQSALFARSYFSAVAAGERGSIGGSEKWGERTFDVLEDSEKASFIAAVADLSADVEELYDSIDFTATLCDDTTGTLSPDGTGIPWTITTASSPTPGMCGKATNYPDEDGMYEFTEAHHTVYLAYQQACGAQPPGECNNTNIELMWNRWQARRHNPNHHYSDVPLLTKSGGYMLQLLYYTTNSFNNDTRYQELFYNNWWADEMFYKQILFAGKRGRYGLGEGPESKWCNEQKSYQSNILHEKAGTVTPGVREGYYIGSHSHCSAVSANMVAGYLPVNSEDIHKHLLLLLEDGDTVDPIPCTDHAILWRASLMDAERGISAGDGREGRITTIDLAPSLMGLASLFLPDKSFFKKYSRHFAHDGEPMGPTNHAELRARRLRREVSKAQLAEGEEILVKCNSLCESAGPVLSQLYDASGTTEQCTIDCAAAYGELFSVTHDARAKSGTHFAKRGVIEKAQLAEGEEILVKCNSMCDATGPVLAELYDASGTPAQCTVDCAAAYGDFFSSVGRQNLTAPARVASNFVRSGRHTTDTSRVLLKCYAECGASRKDASTCTMDCALRHLHVAGSARLTVDLHASWSNGTAKMHLESARKAKAATG